MVTDSFHMTSVEDCAYPPPKRSETIIILQVGKLKLKVHTVHPAVMWCGKLCATNSSALQSRGVFLFPSEEDVKGGGESWPA